MVARRRDGAGRADVEALVAAALAGARVGAEAFLHPDIEGFLEGADRLSRFEHGCRNGIRVAGIGAEIALALLVGRERAACRPTGPGSSRIRSPRRRAARRRRRRRARRAPSAGGPSIRSWNPPSAPAAVLSLPTTTSNLRSTGRSSGGSESSTVTDSGSARRSAAGSATAARPRMRQRPSETTSTVRVGLAASNAWATSAACFGPAFSASSDQPAAVADIDQQRNGSLKLLRYFLEARPFPAGRR